MDSKLTSAVTELIKTLTQFIHFQMRVECKYCGRTYSREKVDIAGESRCKCGHKLFYSR